MKNLKLIGFLMILASSLMFIQCTTDTLVGPQGPAGADGTNGVDGIDGIDGLNGLDGTDGLDGESIAVCIACHADTHRDPIYSSFDLSGHFLGTHTGGNYGSRESCAQCHSNDGYVDLLERGFVQPGGYYTYGPPEYELDDDGNVVLEDDPDSPVFGLPVITNESFNNSSKIRCTTCHNVHRSFDFVNDGNDMALRQGFMPVTFIADNSITVDMGLSNTCTNCHQPRLYDYGVPEAGADVEITSTRYGPHHGPQSSMLYGVWMAEVPGASAYPEPGSSKHFEAACTGCHMGETTDGTDGAHSYWPTDNACLQCHSSVPQEVGGYAADMATLEAKLLDLGAITSSGSSVRGTWPANVAQAVWNYKSLIEDKSNGVHNPTYARALLKNTLDAL